MQYQEFLKRSQRVDFSSHPLNFQGHFLCDEPKTTFPPASLQSQYEPHLASKRERYLFELFALKANTFLFVELFSWFLFFNLLCDGAENIYQFTLTIEQ